MFNSAAGFLWGQNGDAFSSFVTFTASTPNSATITSAAPAGGSELIFDIHATSLTGLKFTNCYYGQITSVIPAESSAVSDVLVTFDSSTGLVGTIAPFIAKRTALKQTQQGSGLTYQAQFTGVWDAKGHNLAPNGASQVAIDPKTGATVSAE
jgi:hypothetical protein